MVKKRIVKRKYFTAITGFIIFIIVVILGLAKRNTNRKEYNLIKQYILLEQYSYALELLDDLGSYKDSSALREEAEKGIIYKEASDFLDNNLYSDAIKLFTEIQGFKNSDEKNKIAKYRWAIELFNNNEYDAAEKILIELDDYEDSKLYLAQIGVRDIEEKEETIYKKAMDYIEDGLYNDAINLLESIEDYKDSEDIIKRIEIYKTVSAGIRYSVAITNKRNALAVGDNGTGSCNINDWENIISIDAYGCLTIGLTANGDVNVAGRYDGKKVVDTEKWHDIIDVAAGERFVVGINDDGTVVADGHNDDGQLKVDEWNNIIDIDAGWSFTVALNKNRELLFAGADHGQMIEFEKQKEKWKNVVCIAASGGGNNENCKGKGHTVGLKLDGTVVAIGDNEYGQCDVSEWKNIIKIAAGDWYTVGLTKDGQVLITGQNIPRMRYIDEEVIKKCNEDYNIVDIAAGFGQTLCLDKDGVIIGFGYDEEKKYTGTENWNDLLVY